MSNTNILRVQFKIIGEDAIDAGGIRREFFNIVPQALFNPDHLLFMPASLSGMWAPLFFPSLIYVLSLSLSA